MTVLFSASSCLKYIVVEARIRNHKQAFQITGLSDNRPVNLKGLIRIGNANLKDRKLFSYQPNISQTLKSVIHPFL